MSEVVFGEHEFDPLDASDFRLSIEGASKTGKSNTLAVLLEDLANVTIPTLVIERLGILSSVRRVDDDIVVVGGRDEPGIDIPVPLDQLDLVGELVLEEGLKVILDISTYSDIGDEADTHTEHRAAATVLKDLNDRAQARLRSGDRRKCLTVIDEVHVLAPENNAPHIDLDDDVRRARAQIVKMATEGGNKGITLISAYQRRAYVSKGVVSQADNYVIHRLHATDRKEVAREIGVDEEEIENLGTGEVLIYGDFTRQRVVGPTKVRKRRSPDPREESFELPEPPEELSSTIERIREQVDVREQQAAERRDRIEELEAERERLAERVEDLEEQSNINERIARAFEDIRTGGDGVDAELAEEFEDLRERNEELQTALEERDARISELEDEVAARGERIDELETELTESRELDVVRDEVASAARTILRQVGASDPEAEDAAEELAELREKKRALEQDLNEARSELQRTREGGVALGDEFETSMDFLRNEAVQKEIQRAAGQTTYSDDHAFDLVIYLADVGEGKTNEELTSHVDVSHSAVKKLTGKLAEHNVLAREKDGQAYRYRLNTTGLEDLVRQQRQREKTTSLRQDLLGGDGR